MSYTFFWKKGGFSKVYVTCRNGQNIAIKVIPHRKKEWTDANGILSEVFILRKLRHVKNISPLLYYHYHKDIGYHMLYFPYYSKTFADFLQERRIDSFQTDISEEEARAFFQQLLTIVLDCRKYNVYHLDIKTDNIMITHHHRLILIDFGCAQISNMAVFYHTGSFLHSPPEWFSQRRFYPELATVWSLGLFLYTTLHGQLPFKKMCDIGKRFRLKRPVSFWCKNFIIAALRRHWSKRMDLKRMKRHPWLRDVLTI